MEVNVLTEDSPLLALYGLGLSFGVTSGLTFDEFTKDEAVLQRMSSVAARLAGKNHGHNKFLRQIHLGLYIKAPRYWWVEFDTYKVGTVSQSESTIHTLRRSPITASMFEGGMNSETVHHLETIRLRKGDDIELKAHLPEAFLQARVVTLNYQNLREIYVQRKNHRLPEWHLFCDAVCSQVAYPEYITATE